MCKIYLMGHTGSINRGCEAIVRSTVKLLNNAGIYDISLVTDNSQYDKKLHLDKLVPIYEKEKIFKYSYKKILSKLDEKLFKSLVYNEKFYFSSVYSNIKKGDLVFVIGGDTYCYGEPRKNYAINKLAKKRGAKTILWGCSLEKKLIDDRMLKDLLRYDYIFPRETITYKTLIDCGIKEDKIILMSDPAFNLSVQPVRCSQAVEKGNNVGINISPIIEKNPVAYNSVVKLIRHILTNTDLNVLLIPHVYGEKSLDVDILNRIQTEVNASDRVYIFKEAYNCEQLKYIISKCRFFIGARTHSTIAAYSQGIPTLVLGYSVKSRGIATDLFGSFKDYVCMYDSLTDNDELLNVFIKLLNNENEIKNNLLKILPEYKKKGIEAAKKIKAMSNFKKINTVYANKEGCNGCGMCVEVCKQKCISMVPDENGFLYPVINHDLCINCGICSRECPQKQTPIKNNIKQVLAMKAKNDETRNNSSSGGVFGVLAGCVIKNNGVVFGAGFDENFNCVHKMATNTDELQDLMRSKYVQSSVGDSYEEVLKHLQNGKMVLFTGTPCQVQALKKYIKGDYDNLVTADFICHGVPSQLAWQKYLEKRKQEYKGNVKSVSFRAKDSGWKTFSMKILFDNGKIYLNSILNDTYLKAFVGNYMLRDSCYNCVCKTKERCSDITLADFWGIDKINASVNDNKGWSMIILRTEKIKKIIDSLKDQLDMFVVDEEKSLSFNPSIVKSVSKTPLKNSFFKDLRNKSDFDKIVEKYSGTGVISRMKRKIIMYVSRGKI